MLSPGLALDGDAVVVNESAETTVDLEGHRAPSDLDALALGDSRWLGCLTVAYTPTLPLAPCC
jgi:hypothetical protein